MSYAGRKTTSMEIIQLTQTYFCFELQSAEHSAEKRAEKFRKKYNEYHHTCYDT